MSSSDYLRTLLAFFVVVNPLSAVPSFIVMTGDETTRDRHAVARASALTVATVLAVSVLGGQWVLWLFGIDVNCFRVGGGILLLLLAVSMFHATPSRSRETPEETTEAGGRSSVGVVPLGTPILAGPGSISTAIIAAQNAHGTTERLALVSICVLVGLSVLLFLRAGEPIRRALGNTGINIATRMMGLILAAMAARFICDGLRELLPGLAKVAS